MRAPAPLALSERLVFADGMRCALRLIMFRLGLLCVLLLASTGWAQSDAGAALDQARQLMKEGLERDLPLPSPQGARAEWPRAEVPPRAPQGQAEPGARRVEAMAERVRHQAGSRARAVAEEKRVTPDNQPGATQSRTKAAKAGPPRPTPPRP